MQGTGNILETSEKTEPDKFTLSFILEKHESDKLELYTNHPWHRVRRMETNQEQDKCCQC